ncbi:hypothetical protein P7K49_022340, partial [Saguinus oedipus]
ESELWSGRPQKQRNPMELAVAEESQGYAVLLAKMKGLAPLDQEAQDSQGTCRLDQGIDRRSM